MEAIKWVVENYDSILLISLGIIAIFVKLRSGKINELKQCLFYIITDVEHDYGHGMGLLKFSMVAEWIYDRIPAYLKPLITQKTIETMINNALVEAKEVWMKNSALGEYATETQVAEDANEE